MRGIVNAVKVVGYMMNDPELEKSYTDGLLRLQQAAQK
jgi:hypothetical protein